MHKTAKPTRQLTFDSLPAAPKKQATETKEASQKQICITQIETTTGIDEVAVKVGFKLLPSRLAFSKVAATLFFEELQISSVLIRVLQSPLATDESEYMWVLDTKGIAAGVYCLKVEMFEVWSSGERSCQTSSIVKVDYVPKTRQSRLRKIPTVKSVAGADVTIVSGQEKEMLLEIEKTVKNEQLTRRDSY
ncbi:MAG: hypothetical protein ACQCN3_08515 [Candidatus Bathyarchaeia archaeon]|jgi:hypothetical protein